MSGEAEVVLWGEQIGAVLLEPGEETAVFQYTPGFRRERNPGLAADDAAAQ